MNRTGLLIGLAILAAAGLVFGLSPALDVDISRAFYDPARGGFRARFDLSVNFARDVVSWLIAFLVAPAAIALVLKAVLPHRRTLISLRASLFLVATMAIGPGLIANVVLKEYWGRPRPADLVEFGGTAQFRPWWDPRGNCPTNCSFIAGEPSTAFWTLAPAALAPPQWRPLAYAAALALGAAVGALRVIAGGHFMSDVLVGGALMFLLIWVAHGVIFRWPRTRMKDG